ncbi:MAG TPA: DUF4331 domain-containing protein [Vicinamibacterales bacterium]|nr:DUF4331 domain-containing protein [Vicinamibacterales bacterium]
MKKAVALVVVAGGLVGWPMMSGHASSHREAPLISMDPMADNTDLYAFRSPDRPDTVTIIANYIPLESPAGGPNFPAFDDSVLYEIHIDNDGDSREDLTYQFRFKTETRNPDTFLYNTGPIASLDDPNWNRPQTYSVRLVRHERGHEHSESGDLLGTGLTTPPDNIGPRSTPNYDALAASAVHTLAGGVRVFAGQRDDPFFVDLGSIFDLAGLRPFNPLHLIPLPAEPGRDAVARYNTHSIALQVPIRQLVSGQQTTIGVYASASRRAVRVLRRDGSRDDFGEYVQVSRLGEPLINEAVIPLGQKDEWNRSDPEDDARFEGFYTSPEVSRLENLLYGSALAPIAESNRTDLVAILLTGVPGLNFTGSRRADLLRLNTSIAPASSPNRLGVLAGDLAGFPNGRRLGDDVIDIELRAFAQGYGPFLNGLLGLPNKSPNNLLGDGVDANDVPFLTTFPYVGTPHQGYQVP